MYYIVLYHYHTYVGQDDLTVLESERWYWYYNTCEHLYLQRADKCTTEWINNWKVLYVFVYREDACNAYTCPKCSWSPISSYHPIFCFEAGFEVVDLAGARFGLDILRLGSGLAPRTERMLPRRAKKIHQISLICLTLNVRWWKMFNILWRNFWHECMEGMGVSMSKSSLMWHPLLSLHYMRFARCELCHPWLKGLDNTEPQSQ